MWPHRVPGFCFGCDCRGLGGSIMLALRLVWLSSLGRGLVHVDGKNCQELNREMAVEVISHCRKVTWLLAQKLF